MSVSELTPLEKNRDSYSTGVARSEDDLIRSFAATIREADGGTVLELHGVADLATAPAVADAVAAYRDRYQVTGQTLDAAGLAFIDSTGWRALVDAIHGADEVLVRNARPVLRRIHALAGGGPLHLA